LKRNEGANVDAKGVSGWSSLLVAAAKKNLQRVNLLLNSGSDINIVDDSGLTP